VNALRARQQRNFLATLLLSQGVPMLLGGDEFSRTQGGNNNAWCQDSEISWFDWGWEHEQFVQHHFTRRLIELRNAHPVFRRQRFLQGTDVTGSGLPDVWWFRPDGRKMTQKDWQRPDGHVLGVFLNGEAIADRDPRGEPIVDDSFLLLFNAHYEDMTFTLPVRRFGAQWEHALCTFYPEIAAGSDRFAARADVLVRARSVKLLRRVG
jgi:isoamylase